MFRYRTGFIVLLAAFGAFAAAQIAPVYQKFGFAKPSERTQKAQTTHVKRRKPRISWPQMSALAAAAAKPQRYDIPISILTEEDKPLYLYPKISFELFQGLAQKSHKVIETGPIRLDSKGNTVVSITVPNAKYQSGFSVSLPDQRDEDPEYEFAEPNKTYVVLPQSPKTKGKAAAKTIVTKQLSLRLRRNDATLTVKGVPPSCRAFVGTSEIAISRQSDKSDVVQLTLPMDVASNENLQLNLVLSDAAIERKATVDAGKLLRDSGTPISAYRLNAFTVPDSDWLITKVGFESVALSSLTPAFGNNPEIALYTEEQAKSVLGEPATTEPVFAFSKPDGSTWLQYPTKGIGLKTRELYLAGRKAVRVVEQVRLTSPAGGKIGGICVGDAGELLYNRFGNGQTSEVFGKARAGYRSYLSQGLQFSLDPATSIVSSIEVWRPFALLKDAVLPVKTNLANRVLISLPVDQLFVTKGSNGQELVKQMPALNARLTTSLKTNKSLRVVESGNEADLVLSWYASELSADGTSASASVTLNATCGGKTATSSFVATATGTKDIEKLASKLGDDIEAKLLELVSRSLDFYVRLKSIDYTTGEIEIDLGTADGVVSGMLFDVSNLDMPAYPDEIEASKGRKGGRVVLQCIKVGDAGSVGQLAYLVKGKNGADDQIIALNKDEQQAQIKRLIDPGTGLLLAKLRL